MIIYAKKGEKIVQEQNKWLKLKKVLPGRFGRRRQHHVLVGEVGRDVRDGVVVVGVEV